MSTVLLTEHQKSISQTVSTVAEETEVHVYLGEFKTGLFVSKLGFVTSNATKNSKMDS